VLIITSCQDNIEKKLIGNWTISLYYGDFTIINNIFSIKNDKTCELPISYHKDAYKEKSRGQWSFFKSDNKSYLKITSANKNFDNIYEITDLRIVQDPVSFGNLQLMTLISQKDSIVIFCRRALYN